MHYYLNRYSTPSLKGVSAMLYLFFELFCEKMRPSGRHHVLTQEVLQDPLKVGVERLVRLGCVRKWLEDGFYVTPDLLERTLTPRIGLFTLSLSCPLTGIVQPVEELAAICKKHNVLFHVDATCGDLSPLKDAKVDYITFQGGLLAESPLRSVEFTSHVGHYPCIQDTLEIAYLRMQYERRLLERCCGATVLFQDMDRLANYSVWHFPGVSSRALLYLLEKRGIYALSAKNALTIYDRWFSECSVSFIFPEDFSLAHIEYVVDHVASCVAVLTKCSEAIV